MNVVTSSRRSSIERVSGDSSDISNNKSMKAFFVSDNQMSKILINHWYIILVSRYKPDEKFILDKSDIFTHCFANLLYCQISGYGGLLFAVQLPMCWIVIM